MNNQEKCKTCNHKPINTCHKSIGNCECNNKWEAIKDCTNCKFAKDNNHENIGCFDFRRKHGVYTHSCTRASEWEAIKPKIKKGCGNCKWNYLNKGISGSTCKIKREEAGCYRKVCHNQTEWEAIEPKTCETCIFGSKNNPTGKPCDMRDCWTDDDHFYRWKAIQPKPKKSCKNCRLNYDDKYQRHCPKDIKCDGKTGWLPKTCDTCDHLKLKEGVYYCEKSGSGKVCDGDHKDWIPIKAKIEKSCDNCRFYSSYKSSTCPDGLPLCDKKENDLYKWQPIEPKPEIEKYCDNCKFGEINNNKKIKCPPDSDGKGCCDSFTDYYKWELYESKTCLNCEFQGKDKKGYCGRRMGICRTGYEFWKPIEKAKPEKLCSTCGHNIKPIPTCPTDSRCGIERKGHWIPIKPKPTNKCSTCKYEGTNCYSKIGACYKSAGRPKWEAKTVKLCSTCIYSHAKTGVSCSEFIGDCNDKDKWAENKKSYTPKSKIPIIKGNLPKETKDFIKRRLNEVKEMPKMDMRKERLQAEIKEVRIILDKEQKRIDDIIDAFQTSGHVSFFTKWKNHSRHYYYQIHDGIIDYMMEYKQLDKKRVKQLKKIRFDKKAKNYKETIEPIEEALTLFKKHEEEYELYRLQNKLCQMKKDCYQDLKKPDCPECGLEQDRKDAKFCFSCGAPIRNKILNSK